MLHIPIPEPRDFAVLNADLTEIEPIERVNCFFRHEVAEKVREEGREEGVENERASMILRILGWRDIAVPDSVRERVQACSDLGQLDIWARRAVGATSAEDLFVDGAV
ncbi:hypothetical protein ACOT81_18770 [Streptomyces sp. WI04-05B]|uniref:hypothetical protein n=1 Tax=Streptomyces TaxID=1883 RepID=UPI0029B1B482|nr:MULTISPECIES: hypothetical protein [unclassified Streptomyces]MDX2542572.1 hypothetical protein [Streptomyces sp. WI04-05B]MDX2582409.1 hypothetical protein [Streptomyces sp. WI04-05A]